MESYDSMNLISNISAPCSSDDSLFFNLLLGTNYENTKENCLKFIINLSKHIYFSKREIFKILINELTLNKYQNKVIGNDESLYLVHQLIKKYSRNNILNALYDYISEKDNITDSNAVENNMISTDSSSMNKNNIPPEKEQALNTKKMNQIFEKENEGEENELNKNDDNQKKDFLSKKRKIPSTNSTKEPIKEKEKKDKKRKKIKKTKKDNNKEIVKD